MKSYLHFLLLPLFLCIFFLARAEREPVQAVAVPAESVAQAPAPVDVIPLNERAIPPGHPAEPVLHSNPRSISGEITR